MLRPLIPRTMLVGLVLAVPVLLAAAALVLFLATLLWLMGDETVSPVFGWIGCGLGLLLLVDLFCLVTALGVRALVETEEREDS